MSMRDAGWIQLYAETNQEALDLHIRRFALPRALMPGHGLHGRLYHTAYERVDVPTQES
jgi:pyruvate ferredoxin oxidoreductase alpha subunit